MFLLGDCTEFYSLRKAASQVNCSKEAEEESGYIKEIP